jgi:hypothetical protein
MSSPRGDTSSSPYRNLGPLWDQILCIRVDNAHVATLGTETSRPFNRFPRTQKHFRRSSKEHPLLGYCGRVLGHPDWSAGQSGARVDPSPRLESVGNNGRHRASRCRPRPVGTRDRRGMRNAAPLSACCRASERQRWASGSRPSERVGVRHRRSRPGPTSRTCRPRGIRSGALQCSHRRTGDRLRATDLAANSR